MILSVEVDRTTLSFNKPFLYIHGILISRTRADENPGKSLEITFDHQTFQKHLGIFKFT